MNNPANIMQILQNATRNNQVMANPMAKNALDMLQKGDSKGLENLARNICKERGVNADDIYNQFKSRFGM